MTARAENDGGGRIPWRVFGWGAAAVLLLLPLVANAPWTVSDFVFAGVVLGSVGLAAELTVRASRDPFYRAGMGLAVAGAVLILWSNGAVGIVGSEANGFNLIYYGILAVAAAGVYVAALRPEGMARAAVATAAALVLAAATALLAGEHRSDVSSIPEILGVTGFLAAPWLASAWLFRKAAEMRAPL